MQQPISTALLAYGMSGKIFHAPFIDAHPGFEFRGVLERNQKKAHLDYPGVSSHDNLNSLLNDKELELIIVNTPNNTHFEYAKHALLAGKHVLIEKPAATSVAQVRELFDLGKKLNKKVLIYQNRRWSSDFMAARELIQSGKLGQIIEAHFRFDRYRSEIGPKFFKEEPIPGSGILYDLGAHMLDQVISIFGKPLSFHKSLGNYRKNTQVPDYAHVQLEYPGPLHVFVTVSLLVAAPTEGIVIHGTQGSFLKKFCDTQEDQLLAGMKPLDIGFGQEKPGMEGLLTLMKGDLEKEQLQISSKKGDFMGLFESVYQCIKHDTPFPVGEAEILAQLEILEA
ncbi:MAG: Gfo/Idh/MocA family oxidoreductase [Sphingobacteriaceae bacterium]